MSRHNMSDDRIGLTAAGMVALWALLAALAFAAVGCKSVRPGNDQAYPFDGVTDPVTERPVQHVP